MTVKEWETLYDTLRPSAGVVYYSAPERFMVAFDDFLHTGMIAVIDKQLLHATPELQRTVAKQAMRDLLVRGLYQCTLPKDTKARNKATRILSQHTNLLFDDEGFLPPPQLAEDPRTAYDLVIDNKVAIMRAICMERPRIKWILWPRAEQRITVQTPTP